MGPHEIAGKERRKTKWRIVSAVMDERYGPAWNCGKRIKKDEMADSIRRNGRTLWTHIKLREKDEERQMADGIRRNGRTLWARMKLREKNEEN